MHWCLSVYLLTRTLFFVLPFLPPFVQGGWYPRESLTLVTSCSASFVPWLIHTCHDSSTYVPWFIHMCSITYSHICHVCHKSFWYVPYVPWFARGCAMTHSHICHDSFIDVPGAQKKVLDWYRVAKTHRMLWVADHFPQRATNYRALLRKMTYKDKGFYGSLTSCDTLFCSIHICILTFLYCMYKCILYV